MQLTSQQVFQTRSMSCERTLWGHAAWVLSLLEVGANVISGSEDGIIKVWEKKTGNCTLTLEAHAAGISALAMNPDFMFTASHDKTIKAWRFSASEHKDKE
jgi:WD40 repeat protein